MKYASLLFALFYLAMAPAKAQVVVDFSAPDKQKYLISGAFISSVTYAWAIDYYKIEGKRNSKKARWIAFGSSVAFGILKESVDFVRSNYQLQADDYLVDFGTLLLSSLSVTATIKLFDSE